MSSAALRWLGVALGVVVVVALLAWRWEAAVAVAAAGAAAEERRRRMRREAGALRAELRGAEVDDAHRDAEAERRAQIAADTVRETPLADEGDPTASSREWLK